MGAVQSRRRSSAATDRGAVDLVSSSAAADLPLRVAEPQFDDSISEVFPKLYIGQQSAALNLSLVRKLGIRAFVNCSNRAAPEYLGQERDLSCLAVPVHDDPKEAISQHFERAAQWARTKDGLTLLVFCMSGISRSATIVLVLLMKNRAHTATRTPHNRAQGAVAARVVSPLGLGLGLGLGLAHLPACACSGRAAAPRALRRRYDASGSARAAARVPA